MKFGERCVFLLAAVVASFPRPGFGYADQAHTNMSTEAVANTKTLSANLPLSV